MRKATEISELKRKKTGGKKTKKIKKTFNIIFIARSKPSGMDGSEKGKLFFFCVCFCLVRLLPGTGLIACSALGEALPLSCQRFCAAKELKRKEKNPKLDLCKSCHNHRAHVH